MHDTNVELSKNESDLVISSEFILTKNRIITKVYNLFGLLSEAYKGLLTEFKDFLPDEILNTSPKIYKGENYLNLPYVMMDHPRIFLKNDVFAIRSFFWWGNYFSITLQLSGKFLQAFSNNIIQHLDKEDGYFVCVNNEQWQHHFEETNYKPLNEIDLKEKILKDSFFKIAKKIPLTEWNNAEEFFKNNYKEFLKIITANS